MHHKQRAAPPDQSSCTVVSCPASLSHAEKESRIHTYVTYSDTGTMNVIISGGAITVYSRKVFEKHLWRQRDPWTVESECYACLVA